MAAHNDSTLPSASFPGWLRERNGGRGEDEQVSIYGLGHAQCQAGSRCSTRLPSRADPETATYAVLQDQIYLITKLG